MDQYRQINPRAIREYDIRGLSGREITPEDAGAIGRGFGATILREGGRLVCVGRDARQDSKALEQALVDALLGVGIDVVRIGLATSPQWQFAVRTFGADGGIMITASHNPKEFNGFKFFGRTGPWHGERIRALARLAASGPFPQGRGTLEDRDAAASYLAALLDTVPLRAALTVAWDCSNGPTGPLVTRLVAALPGRHIVLNAAVDGSFPAHPPDPSVADNLQQLRQAVLAQQCDLGVAFDGDGDRIGVVSASGRIVLSDDLLAVFARDILRLEPGATVVFDVKSSPWAMEEVRRHGGTPLLAAAGRASIRAAMGGAGAVLGGELSGHLFFRDWHGGIDDAVYAALRLIRQLGLSGTPLDQLAPERPGYFSSPEIRLDVPAAVRSGLIAGVRDMLPAGSGFDLIDVDGLRCHYPDGWWLLRLSNTEDKLVLRIEAASAERFDGLARMIAAALAASGVPIDIRRIRARKAE